MMTREPASVPRCDGVFALINRKRRYAYVGYTENLQKRSHSLSHSLTSADKSKKAYWPIRNLPRHHSDEYVFAVIDRRINPARAEALVATAQDAFRSRNYTIVKGSRSPQPMVTFDGKSMTLVDALKLSESKVAYATAYRRIERGWTARQALGLDTSDPRWDRRKQAERRKRAA